MAKDDHLGFDLMDQDEEQPHLTVNDAVRRLSDAQNDVLAVDVAAGDVTLTIAQAQSYGLLVATGAPGVARNLTVPDPDAVQGWSGERRVEIANTSDSNLTVAFATPGQTVTLAPGARRVFHLDAPDVLEVQTSISLSAPLEANDEVVRRPHLRDPSETVATPSISAGALTLDYEQGPVFEVTLTENVTSVSVTNPPASGRAGALTLILVQDATGGRTFDFTFAEWDGATVPSVSSAAGARDVYTFLTTAGGAPWNGFVAGQGMG